MKNLVTLNELELERINGGALPLIFIGKFLLGAAATYIVTEVIDGVVNGFTDNCSCK